MEPIVKNLSYPELKTAVSPYKERTYSSKPKIYAISTGSRADSVIFWMFSGRSDNYDMILIKSKIYRNSFTLSCAHRGCKASFSFRCKNPSLLIEYVTQTEGKCPRDKKRYKFDTSNPDFVNPENYEFIQCKKDHDCKSKPKLQIFKNCFRRENTTASLLYCKNQTEQTLRGDFMES